MSTSTIAFIGLGHMGGPMAANLAKAGYRVIGYDLAPAALEAVAQAGVAAAESARAAVAAADVVVTMLQSGAQVIGLYRDVLDAAKPGTLFVDCSTVDVADARVAAELAEQAGMRAVDAPVSGGVSGASAGTLTFMVGGPDDAIAAARPLLEVMGAKVVHCGGAGVGQAAKICNNMVLGATMIAISEAFVLGEQLGLSNQAFYDVASTASAQCWALTSYCPVPGVGPVSPADNDYRPGFSAALMHKDLGLAAKALRDNHVDGVIGEAAARIYARFAERTGGAPDFSAIVTDIRDRSTATPDQGDQQ
jgi:3-hydroxyisobutyrate dehydrogenase